MTQITAEDLLRRGAERHRQGRIEEAESFYRRALRLTPNHPDALNLLGVAARQRGDLAAALDFSERALRAMPDQPGFQANRGATLAEAGRLAEALPLLRAAAEARAGDAVAWRNLGQALAQAGQAAAAIPVLERATALDPASPEAALMLAHARREAGQSEPAREAARQALALAGRTPALADQARFLLAALGEGEAPARAPATYVRELFDAFAPRFDAELEGALGYRTPALLAGMLGVGQRGRVLDLGCGTGLSGLALRPLAARLEGVDLSPRMLAEARARGCYDALHEADLLEFLPRRAAAWDAIMAADVLNYLGDLAPVFAAMRHALRPGGGAAFSLEAGEAPVALGEGLRYRHNPEHVAEMLAAAGFAVLDRKAATLRRERGGEVEGVLFLVGAQGG
jgi:predicted TPR repeat methyltransferase